VKLIPIRKAVGMVLDHDTTENAPGRLKGPAFKRGHVIWQEEVPLKSGSDQRDKIGVGPRYVYDNIRNESKKEPVF
jgi:hypothetical protein